MRWARGVAVLLMIAAVAAGALAQPIDPPDRAKPEACRRFVSIQEIGAVRSWDTLEIVTSRSAVSAELAQAELARIGGARLVLEVDADAIRRELLETSRDEIRRMLREARLPSAVRFRGDAIEVAPRNDVEPARVLSLLQTLTAGPFAQLAARPVDPDRAGVVALTLTEVAVANRMGVAERQAVSIIERRARELGLNAAAMPAQPRGRIVVMAPGLPDAQPLTRMMQVMPSASKLTFQIGDPSVDACAAGASPPADIEILRTYKTKASLLVERRVLAGGQNVADVVVALDPQTRAPGVAFRLDPQGAERLARATRDNPRRVLAIALDHEIVAAPSIAEPIETGMARISGALDLAQAHELATLLRAGILPAKLNVIETGTVAPASRP